jgi:predicted GTPase
MEPSYLRYLEHQLRAVEPFTGSPLRLETRVKSRDKVKT